jgi:hypothetical protein
MAGIDMLLKPSRDRNNVPVAAELRPLMSGSVPLKMLDEALHWLRPLRSKLGTPFDLDGFY